MPPGLTVRGVDCFDADSGERTSLCGVEIMANGFERGKNLDFMIGIVESLG